MKRKILILAALFVFCSLSAQNQTVVTTEIDSLPPFEPMPSVNVEFVGKNILEELSAISVKSGKVNVSQSPAMKAALSRHIAKNESRKIHGYRVRIFFDNSQNARSKSESVAGMFSSMYPGVAVYRSYASPFFKVTVGNFRTRTEAQLFANNLNGIFPSAFIVRENINYPSLW